MTHLPMERKPTPEWKYIGHFCRWLPRDHRAWAASAPEPMGASMKYVKVRGSDRGSTYP